jgi:transcriptional regulator
MKTSPPRDLFPGALEMMVLESLRRQPAHGYALVQHIQQRSNNLLQVEEGSLYPALQRLLKAKLVKAEWGVSATNRRVRTYQITPPVCAIWNSRDPASNACLKASPWSSIPARPTERSL